MTEQEKITYNTMPRFPEDTMPQFLKDTMPWFPKDKHLENDKKTAHE